MSAIYAAALQTTRLNAVVSAIDVNASPATLEIGTAAMALVLVTITLSDPSFVVAGTPPNVAATMQGMPKSANATAGGVAAAARIKDGGGNIIVSGLTVGVGGGFDISLNATTITATQQVTINAPATITHPNV